MRSPQEWIDLLALVPHPEGGHYVESYRASGSIHPAGFEGPRSFSTAIYFLLRAGECSRLHRLRSDEMWHHYEGAPLALHVLRPGGELERLRLGKALERGERPQAVVRAGCWFGATVEAASGHALVGCTVSPGFDFRDFELGDRSRLLELFPRHRALVERLTR